MLSVPTLPVPDTEYVNVKCVIFAYAGSTTTATITSDDGVTVVKISFEREK